MDIKLDLEMDVEDFPSTSRRIHGTRSATRGRSMSTSAKKDPALVDESSEQKNDPVPAAPETPQNDQTPTNNPTRSRSTPTFARSSSPRARTKKVATRYSPPIDEPAPKKARVAGSASRKDRSMTPSRDTQPETKPAVMTIDEIALQLKTSLGSPAAYPGPPAHCGPSCSTIEYSSPKSSSAMETDSGHISEVLKTPSKTRHIKESGSQNAEPVPSTSKVLLKTKTVDKVEEDEDRGSPVASASTSNTEVIETGLKTPSRNKNQQEPAAKIPSRPTRRSTRSRNTQEAEIDKTNNESEGIQPNFVEEKVEQKVEVKKEAESEVKKPDAVPTKTRSKPKPKLSDPSSSTNQSPNEKTSVPAVTPVLDQPPSRPKRGSSNKMQEILASFHRPKAQEKEDKTPVSAVQSPREKLRQKTPILVESLVETLKEGQRDVLDESPADLARTNAGKDSAVVNKEEATMRRSSRVRKSSTFKRSSSVVEPSSVAPEEKPPLAETPSVAPAEKMEEELRKVEEDTHLCAAETKVELVLESAPQQDVSESVDTEAKCLTSPTVNETEESTKGETAPPELKESDLLPTTSIDNSESPVVPIDLPSPSSAKKSKSAKKQRPAHIPKNVPSPSTSVSTPPSRTRRSISKPSRFDDFVTPEVILKPRAPEPKPKQSPQIKLKLRFSTERPRKVPQVEPVEPEPIDDSINLPSESSTEASTEPAEDKPTEEQLEIEETKVVEQSPHIKLSPKKTDGRKRNSQRSRGFLPGYTPKRVTIEDWIRPDGTIEKIGNAIHNVMDKILTEVCRDGITRHYGVLTKTEQKKAVAEMAKQKYNAKKEEYAELKKKNDDAKPAQVVATPEAPAESASPAVEESRVRKNRGNLYKENPFIQKTKIRLQKESMSPEPQQHRKARTRQALDYLNQCFLNDEDADLAAGSSIDSMHSPRVPSLIIKKTEQQTPSQSLSYKEFISTKTEHSRFPHDMLSLSTTADSSQDFFYRDVLLEHPNQQADVDDENIDVDTIEDLPEQTVEVDMDRKALEAATKIDQLIVRTPYPDGQTAMDDIFQRALEQSEQRQAMLHRASDIIKYFYVAQYENFNYPSAVHSIAVSMAADLREVFAMYNETQIQSVMWMHAFLIELLPVHLLSSYLFLLKYLKSVASTPCVSWLLQGCSVIMNYGPWLEVSRVIADFMKNGHVRDPEADIVNQTLTPGCLPDVIFVLLPPKFNPFARFHQDIFRWLKFMGHNESQVIALSDSKFSVDAVSEYCDLWIDIIVKKVRNVVKQHRDKRVVLVGWGITCYASHRVVQLTHGISALIDLAFPVSVNGFTRGDPDDDMLLTYCPSLFICGSRGRYYNSVAMHNLRKSMIAPAGLVIVHGADDDLHVHGGMLARLNLTQSDVFRIVMEHIKSFLCLKETQRERSHLIPVDLNCVYQADMTSLSVNKAPVAVKSPMERGDTPSVAAREPKPKKRKVATSTILDELRIPPFPTPSPLASPTTARPPGGEATTAARMRFEQMVNRLGSSSATSQRPVYQSTKPSVNPANISLQ